jgi:hypothetical protein
MRPAIIVVAALVASACTGKHPVHIAATPSTRIPADSGVSDSLIYRDLRRLILRSDSLLMEIRAGRQKPPVPPPFQSTAMAQSQRSIFADSALHVL